MTSRARASLAVAALLVAAAAVVLGSGQRPAGAPQTRGVFVHVALMPKARDQPVVVALADGRVLIAASAISNGKTGAPAEVFDPADQTLTPVTGERPSGRGTGVLLRDGRVLVITFDNNRTSSVAYLFDPISMSSRSLPQAGLSNNPPFGVQPSMAVLNDGRVLIAGGKLDVYKDDLIATTMLFDPATETFVPTGSMRDRRRYQSMVTLPDGRVLVAGGEQSGPPAFAPDGTMLVARGFLQTAEVYDPISGAFTSIPPMAAIRGATIALLLPDDSVLVAPLETAIERMRESHDTPSTVRRGEPAPIEIFDPATGSFSILTTIPEGPEAGSVLADGRVLLIGTASRPTASVDGPGRSPWALILDPTTRSLQFLAPPPARFGALATLADGRTVLVGGFDLGGDLETNPAGSREVDILE